MAKPRDISGIGAGVGAAVGSVVPGAGTAIGGAIGGAIEDVWKSRHVDWTKGKTLNDIHPGTTGSTKKRDYDIIAHYAGVTSVDIGNWQIATHGMPHRMPNPDPYHLRLAIQNNRLNPDDVKFIFQNHITFFDYVQKKKKVAGGTTQETPPIPTKIETAPKKKGSVLPILGAAAYFLLKK